MLIQKGTLYIVATPIGNLGDITFRAVEILKKVDCIAAEDTRHSRKLLTHYKINTPMISLHKHNEQVKSEKILTLLRQNKSIALISDAGTPLISDPGYSLILKAQQECKVIPIPGPSAIIAALSVASLPTERFCFEGFLPAKPNARLKHLQTLVHESRTLVFYETPHRLLDSLRSMIETFGPTREATLARELTKTFEQVVHDSLENLLHHCQTGTIPTKGEFVVLVQGHAPKATQNNIEMERILKILFSSLSLKQAVELTHKITEQNRSNIYKTALKLKEKEVSL